MFDLFLKLEDLFVFLLKSLVDVGDQADTFVKFLLHGLHLVNSFFCLLLKGCDLVPLCIRKVT